MKNEEEYKSFISEIECCYFGPDRERRYLSVDEKNLVRAAVYRLWFYDEFRRGIYEVGMEEIHAMIWKNFSSDTIDGVLHFAREHDLTLSVDFLCHEFVMTMLTEDILFKCEKAREKGEVLFA